MRRIVLLGFIALFSRSAFSQMKISIIPEPVKITTGTGYYQLPDQLTVSIPNRSELKVLSQSILSRLIVTGKPVVIGRTNTAVIRFELLKTPDNILGKEGYTLSVKSTGVVISANQPAGLFYGAQTLWQLFPKEIMSRSKTTGVNWKLPAVEITDYPRFAWRGLMFDVSRHFFTKQDVKDFIDQMIQYKFNLLHMHLTDDEGWRIEIKSLPRLTTVGAWNVKRVGTFGKFAPIPKDEPKDYGGFYTQDDIREIVQYAKDRFVDILPEIDVPGHSMAAVVAYPDLSCTPGADQYQVISGEKFIEWPPGAHFYGLVDNTLCPANEKVYPFLDKVFTEVAALFPFPYIHVGGDECARNFWEKSDAVKQLMQNENLKNMDEVQAYFEKRIEKIVESKGKKMIGWDEILEGGIAPNAVIMSWRGLKGGIAAAKLGHQIVMSPQTYVYLDYMQGDSVIEPPVYDHLRLNTTYAFEPVPDGVDAKFVLGGQANLWTEQVYNIRHLQYMVWPRALSVSETLWSPKEKKDWNHFASKVEDQFDRMDLQSVKYARSMFDPMVETSKNSVDSLVVTLKSEVEGLDIHYSFDNSHPDNYYPVYKEPLLIPKDAIVLKVITYRGNQLIGREMLLPIEMLKKRAKLK
jgi:hexosaminidase